MINVTQAMRERRSARAYLSKPVPVDTIPRHHHDRPPYRVVEQHAALAA